ncbi:MAG: fumarate hydratase [Candidatus Omnitrophica bacterium]|nr:fumarate hydratase [Candidatus Omnitrophota bacterium]
MRKISAEKIVAAVSHLCIDSNYRMNKDLIALLKKNQQREKGRARRTIASILENIKIAEGEKIPICQDTGMVTIFLEIGNNLKINLGRYSSLSDIIQEGVRRGYKDGYLRKSIVNPLSRVNTKDNTPAIIHEKIVVGSHLKIKALIKGFGAENMAKIRMLPPDSKEEEIKIFVIDSIKEASSNPCPPVIVGIGIGGTMEKAASLAEEALLEPVMSKIEKFEKELLTEINKLNIGPAGLGGKTTASSVRIKTFPTHIAGLPVAVNISCWANRHKEIII